MKVINPRLIFCPLWLWLLLNLYQLIMPLQSSAESPKPTQTQDVPSDQEADQEDSTEAKTKQPTPEETARLAKLAIADQLYARIDYVR